LRARLVNTLKWGSALICDFCSLSGEEEGSNGQEAPEPDSHPLKRLFPLSGNICKNIYLTKKYTLL